MSREHEIQSVAVDFRDQWLAGQVDEISTDVTSRLMDQSEELREMKAELSAMRGVLTKVLLGLIGALVAVPIGLWVFIINHAH